MTTQLPPDARPDPGARTGADTRACPDAPSAARPLRRDAEANRRQLLAAAGRLMAERGLACPLEEIAAEAGVGIGTLYRRFPTREALVEALFEDRLEAYVADLEAAVGMQDSWEALTYFLRRSVARQIADRGLAQLVDEDLGSATLRRKLAGMVPLGEELVERARRSGRIRPDFALSDLLIVQHTLSEIGAHTRHVDPQAWERYLVVVLDGLVTSREAPTEARQAVDFAALKAVRPERCRA